MKSLAPGAALSCAALCALGASSAAALERAELSPDTNPAVVALLETAEQDLNAGQPAEAAVVLERALLIEPGNPTVWYYLGLARFDQGNYSQAEAMAAKSHTLASADRSLRVRNAGLMASAQQAAGKRVSVPSDERPISALRRLFATEVEPARTYADTIVEPELAADPPGWRRRPQSIIVFDGRQYRRVIVPSEGNRRRRY